MHTSLHGVAQFLHNHMSSWTHTHTHKSIPRYSNLTLHLPLSDKTCIINVAKCCQETSDSYQPPLAHTWTHQQHIHHNITRF